MLAGFWLADVLGQALLASQGLRGGSPISGVPVAIVIGLLLRNFVRLPHALTPGLKFCVTTVLRLGIVLVGIKLSAFDVVRHGLAGLPVVVAAIATGLIFVTWFNRKLGLPPRLGTLIAAGTSICGVTAIVSTAPAIEADERDVAYAVANVVAFGLFGMLTYPYFAHAVLGRSETVGLFLGTAIHDTSQVVGAALTYRQMYADEVVLQVATVTKLTRNLFLAAVIPLLTWLHVRGHRGTIGARPPTTLTTYVPGLRHRLSGDGRRAHGRRPDAPVRRRLRRVGCGELVEGHERHRRFLGIAHPARDRDGGRGPQHELQRVQRRGRQAVCRRPGRRARRRRGRHGDGDPGDSIPGSRACALKGGSASNISTVEE